VVPGESREVLSVAAGSPARRCGIVGHPVAHSLSPVLYEAVFAASSLPWTYDRIDLPYGGLAGFVAGLDASWRGLSVTAPHKPEAIGLGEPDEAARLTGVANTLVFEATGRIASFNTDVPGVRRACESRGVAASSAVVIGAGATARSVVAGLARSGLRRLTVQLRDPVKATPLRGMARALGLEVSVTPIGPHGPCDLVVSTLPAGAADPWAETLVAGAPAVFDVAYTPWPTRLMQAGLDAGATVVDGLDLLAGQAVDQAALICGATLPGPTMRALLAGAVADEAPGVVPSGNRSAELSAC